MATVQVRMDQSVKVRFDEFVSKLNKFRAKKKQSKLTSAQVLEMALDSLIEKVDLLK